VRHGPDKRQATVFAGGLLEDYVGAPVGKDTVISDWGFGTVQPEAFNMRGEFRRRGELAIAQGGSYR